MHEVDRISYRTTRPDGSLVARYRSTNTSSALREIANRFKSGEILTARDFATIRAKHGLSGGASYGIVSDIVRGRFEEETGVRVKRVRDKNQYFYRKADSV